MKLPVKYKEGYYIATETFFVGKQEYVVVGKQPVFKEDVQFLTEVQYLKNFVEKDGYTYDLNKYRYLTEDYESIIIYNLGDKYHTQILSDYNSIVLDSDKILLFQKSLEHCEILNNIKCENK